MSKRPLISVIVLNYNGKEDTQGCVDSVLRSTYKPFEVVIIDNGSTDSSYEYLQARYNRKKSVIIVRSAINLSFTGGCNLGVKHSKGSLVVFLNNDCTVDKDWLGPLVETILHRNIALVQPKILRYDNKKIIDNIGGCYSIFGFGFGNRHNKLDQGQYEGISKTDYVNGTSFMIKKSCFNFLGGFDEWFKHHYEDVDLCLRAQKNSGECYYNSKSVIYHKISQTFQAHIAPDILRYNVRKNRLMVVTNNFEGLERIVRLTILLMIYIIFILTDLFSFDKKKATVTIKSIIACFERYDNIFFHKTFC